MPRSKISVVAFAVSLSLFGCESSSPSYRYVEGPKDVRLSGNIKAIDDTLIFADDKPCLDAGSRGRLGFLAAAVLPALISTGLSAFQTAIKNAAQADTATLTASLNGISNGKAVSCVTVISGRFAGRDSETPVARPDWYTFGTFQGEADKAWERVEQFLHARNMTLDGQPDLVFQAQMLSVTKEKTYARIVPLYLAFHRAPPSHRSIFRRHPISDLAISITVALAGNKDAVAGTVDMGLVQAGQSISINDDMLSKCSSSNTCDQTVFLKEALWSPIDTPGSGQPVAISVSVTENRTPSAWAQFLADMLGSGSTNIAAEINKALVPSAGRAVTAAELTANATMVDTYKKALQTTIAGLQACKAAVGKPDVDAAHSALLDAQSGEAQSNAAAFAIGLPMPFPVPTKSTDQCSADLDVANQVSILKSNN